MNYKVASIVVLLLALPLAVCSVEESDAEIVNEGKLESYYYDGNNVHITETIKTNSNVYLEDRTISYDEVKVTYINSIDSEVSHVQLWYYMDNVPVYNEEKDVRHVSGEEEQLEENVGGDWVTIVPVDDRESVLSVENKLSPAIIRMGINLFKEIARWVGQIAAEIVLEYIFEPGTEVPPFEDPITDDITILRSPYHGTPLMFYVDGFAVPALKFTDDNLKKLEPFQYYFVLGNTIAPSDLRYICPVGLTSTVAEELLGFNATLYNIWSATSDSCELLCSNMGDGMTWHTDIEICGGYGHYHFKIDGKMSNSRAYYGLYGDKVWEPEDGDQWWFD